MATQTEAAILWFDPVRGTGAIQTDEGRHFRFFARLPFNPRPGRKVLVELDPEGETVHEQVRVTAMPGGKNVQVDIEEVTVQYALAVEGLPQVSRPRGVEAPRPVPDPQPPKAARRHNLKRKYPPKQPGEAFRRGMSVLHPVHGQGYVQISTLRVARVLFGFQERGVRVEDLTSLD
jgi:hypothetical protein